MKKNTKWIKTPTMKFRVNFEGLSRIAADRVDMNAYADFNHPAPDTKRGERSIMDNLRRRMKSAGISIQGQKPFKDGQVLDLGLQFEGIPTSIKALALATQSETRIQGPHSTHHASIHFIGIHKADLAKGERYLLIRKRSEAVRSA